MWDLPCRHRCTSREVFRVFGSPSLPCPARRLLRAEFHNDGPHRQNQRRAGPIQSPPSAVGPTARPPRQRGWGLSQRATKFYRWNPTGATAGRIARQRHHWHQTRRADRDQLKAVSGAGSARLIVFYQSKPDFVGSDMAIILRKLARTANGIPLRIARCQIGKQGDRSR
jgi:hypothetical protein